MTRKRWYSYSLLLPLLVPLLIMFAAKLTGTFMNGQRALGWLSLIATLELVCGGFQYTLFLFFVKGWGGEKTATQLWRASWALPLWFWPWCTVWLLLVTVFIGRIKNSLMIGLFAIPFGYFYVILTHLITAALRLFNIVKD